MRNISFYTLILEHFDMNRHNLSRIRHDLSLCAMYDVQFLRVNHFSKSGSFPDILRNVLPSPNFGGCFESFNTNASTYFFTCEIFCQKLRHT